MISFSFIITPKVYCTYSMYLRTKMKSELIFFLFFSSPNEMRKKRSIRSDWIEWIELGQHFSRINVHWALGISFHMIYHLWAHLASVSLLEDEKNISIDIIEICNLLHFGSVFGSLVKLKLSEWMWFAIFKGVQLNKSHYNHSIAQIYRIKCV